MDESQILAEAIADAWPDEPSTEVIAIEGALMDALRALDAATPEDEERLQSQVLAVIGTVADLHQSVQAAIDSLMLLADRGTRADPAVETRRRSEVSVIYATNRLASTTDEKPQSPFGATRGTALSYGIAQVQVPDDHRMGELPKARPWRLKFARNGQSDIVYRDTKALIPAITELSTQALSQDSLVFVHGYNVSFEDAIRRTAQLTYDLNFHGFPILFSWPSAHKKISYPADGESAAASLRHFRQFLDELMKSSLDGRVHVVAHSMGNRILADALTRIDYRLGQVIFAAPDVDATVFRNHASDFLGRADRYTLYVSENDKALNLATRLANFPRAGSAGNSLVVVAGVDSIDASQLDTGLVSHSYAMDNRSVLGDIYYLIWHQLPPEKRAGLEPMSVPQGRYWRFRR